MTSPALPPHPHPLPLDPGQVVHSVWWVGEVVALYSDKLRTEGLDAVSDWLWEEGLAVDSDWL